MNSYNPFRAAAAELVSPAARQYYVLRSQQDIQTILILVIELACMAYELGFAARQWVDEFEKNAADNSPDAVIENNLKLLIPSKVAGYLMPAKDEAVNDPKPEQKPTLALPEFSAIALLSAAPEPTPKLKPAAKPKAKNVRKPSAKPAAKKAPGIAGRKEPTRVKVGGRSVCID